MAKPFFETTRSLKADGYRGSYLTLLLVTIFATVWVWWFFTGDIDTWELTDAATLEVSGKAYRVDSPLAGKVAQRLLEVDKAVTAGDVLVVLDSSKLALELTEERARLAGYHAQVKAARAQGDAALAALQRSLEETENQLAKSQSEWKTAHGNTEIRRDVAARYARLAEENMVSELENLDARNKLEQAAGAEESLALTRDLHRSKRSTTTHQLEVTRAEIEERITELQGNIGASEEVVKRLELEIEEHTVRAPISGKLGEVAALQPGSFLQEGYALCTIVPPGKPRVFARFPPGDALGRIRPGQPATVRLKGFPWTQYGSLHAVVGKVGTEPRDGKIQVDLDLVAPGNPRIPIQHGMPGTVEVKVGTFSPLALVLRAVGVRMQGGEAGS